MMRIRPFIRLALCGSLALAACEKPCREGSEEGGGSDLAGTSVGCGNPPRVADLHPTDVNGCLGVDCGHAGRPISFRIALGKSLDLRFEFRPPPVSQQVRIHVYAADQIPMFRQAPLDSFSLTSGNGLLLKPEDLAKAMREYDPDAPASGLFPFNVHIMATEISGGLEYRFEALLAGLGLDIGRGTFISSRVPSWGTGSLVNLLPIDAVFQGRVAERTLETGLSAASAAYVYIPGSPFAAEIDTRDSTFRMEGLTEAGYELRMISIPAEPSDHGAAVFLLRADPDSLPARPFHAVGIVDTVTIPGNFP